MSVFKHYLPGNWRIGRNFLNPLYEDSKASCNVYFDRHSGMYKMKDFGDDSYSGDCFSLVGQLKRLDCNRASDFIEILATIDRDLGLGLASGIPALPTGRQRPRGRTHPKSPPSPTSSGNRSSLPPNWNTGDNTASRPNCWNGTRSVRSGNTTAKRRRENPTPTRHRQRNPCSATRASGTSSCTDRSPHPASSMAAASARAIASGWSNCPPKVIHYSSRAERKTCFRWRRMVSTPSASTARR